MTVGFPLGLLGLVALPAIVWLHRYVVQAHRRPVSNLDLWADALHAGAEGATPRRPPLTWVLLLELLAATALVAALADVRIGGPTLPRPTVGVVLDTSASLFGGAPGQRPVELVAEQLRTLPPSTRVVLAAGWPAPRVLADGPVAKAVQALATVDPAAPAHELEPAMALARSVGAPEVWVFTDDPDVALPNTVHLGAPADNVGFVGVSWPPGGAPTVALRAFGPADVPITLTVRAGSTESSVELVAPHHAVRTLALPVADEALEVSLAPGGALAIDDRVWLVPPAVRAVPVRVALPDGPAANAFRAAVRATARLDDTAPWLVIGDAGPVSLLLGGPADHLATHITADPFSPLMAGVSAGDLVWPASAATPPAGAQVHLTSAEGPLLWQVGATFTLNLDPDGATNLFRREAFVALVANLVDEVARQHGQIAVQQVRTTDVVSLLRAPEWTDPRWTAPDGVRPLPEGRRIDLGPGLPVGIHTVADQEFAVSFADPHESDLTRRVATADPWRPSLVAAAAQAPRDASSWPWLAAAAALIGAWALLGRAA